MRFFFSAWILPKGRGLYGKGDADMDPVAKKDAEKQCGKAVFLRVSYLSQDDFVLKLNRLILNDLALL